MQSLDRGRSRYRFVGRNWLIVAALALASTTALLDNAENERVKHRILLGSIQGALCLDIKMLSIKASVMKECTRLCSLF